MNGHQSKSLRRILGFKRIPKTMDASERRSYRAIKRRFNRLPGGRAREAFLDNVSAIEQILREEEMFKRGSEVKSAAAPAPAESSPI
jgi:hypothetical protein